MLRNLWKFSIPHRAARSNHRFIQSDDNCSIFFDFERYPEVLPIRSGSILRLTLSFSGVVKYQTFSEREQSAEMIRMAGETLVDMGETPWLAEFRSKRAGVDAVHLRHLMIGFTEDGTYYEFICSGYSIVEEPSPAKEIPW